jgi:Ca2+/Na+ antiporter
MTKNKNQISVILEYFWLIVVILSGIKGIIDTFKRGFSESYMIFIICALALFLFLIRRSLRLKSKHENTD